MSLEFDYSRPHGIRDNVPYYLTEAQIAEVQAREAQWAAGASARAAMQQILNLEASVTQRRLREAALTVEGKAWLEDVDAQIAALRAQL